MTTCPRCGSPLRSLPELADHLERMAGRAASARDAMRGLLPSLVPAALVTLEVDLPRAAGSIRCHAGTCAPASRLTRAANRASRTTCGTTTEKPKERNHS